jgi:hypothetical protein
MAGTMGVQGKWHGGCFFLNPTFLFLSADFQIPHTDMPFQKMLLSLQVSEFS